MSRPGEPLREHEPSHRPAVGLLLCAATAVVLGVAVIGSPREHAPLPALARYALSIALPRWHTTEPVNEIVYGSRGFDTFGETFLLLAAVIGVVVITRGREHRRGFIGEEQAGAEEQAETGRDRRPGAEPVPVARRADERERRGGWDEDTPDATPLGRPGPETADAMTIVARGAVRFLAPVLVTAGAYLCAWGYTPGGGFPAGAVLLGVVLLVYVAFGYRRVEALIRPDTIEPVELAGALAIILLGLGGLVFEGSLTASFLPLGKIRTIRAGGVLQVFSVSELVEVSSGLTLVIFGLLGMGHDWSDDDDDENRNNDDDEADGDER
ncbi:MAG TPA: MnhB domain-containing protein [Acidimicrobiia bacterium]|nr:MnhB domain-containing protein [Acidimicrobiia bacterium]